MSYIFWNVIYNNVRIFDLASYITKDNYSTYEKMKNFHEKYYQDILLERNKLAHAKKEPEANGIFYFLDKDGVSDKKDYCPNTDMDFIKSRERITEAVKKYRYVWLLIGKDKITNIERISDHSASIATRVINVNE